MLLFLDLETDGLTQYVVKEPGVTMTVAPKILEIAARLWWPGHPRHGEVFHRVVGWKTFDVLKMHEKSGLNARVLASETGMDEVVAAWNAWVPQFSYNPVGKNVASFDLPICKAWRLSTVWAKHRCVDLGSVAWRGGTVPEAAELLNGEEVPHTALADVAWMVKWVEKHLAEKSNVAERLSVEELPEWLKIGVAQKYSPLSR